ncbi:protein serine/threonine phosphatase [Aureococcus anophagefferens]|nr:protein serine/threonine phosphatase [Aureococcus anophagefferens]
MGGGGSKTADGCGRRRPAAPRDARPPRARGMERRRIRACSRGRARAIAGAPRRARPTPARAAAAAAKAKPKVVLPSYYQDAFNSVDDLKRVLDKRVAASPWNPRRPRGRSRRILTDTKEQGELFKFLKTEFAEELLDCYRAIRRKELFKKGDDQAPRIAEAKRINDVYCKPGAEFQVNLSSRLVRKLKKDLGDDANVTVHLYDKISDDLVLMIAKDKLKRFVETRRAEEQAAIEEAEREEKANPGKKKVRATQAVRIHQAVDEFPHRFLAPDFFRGQLGLKDLAYPPIDDDVKTPLHRFSCGAVSTHGQNHGKYKVNQDRCLARTLQERRDPEGATSCLFLCADGHGKDGHYVADYVVKRVLDEMGKACAAPDSGVLKAWDSCYDIADKNLNDFDELGLDRQSSGTTCVGAMLVGDDLWVASTGDAKIVLGQVSEKCALQAVQVTVEHKITDATEIQRIEEAGGVVEPAPGYACDRIWFDESFSGPGLQPTRTLGDHAAKKIGVIATPDVSHVKLTASDKFIILASDGVWEYVSNRQAVRFVEASLRLNVNEPLRAEMAAKYLVNIATKYWINEGGGYQDDISATVVVLDPPVWKKKYE